MTTTIDAQETLDQFLDHLHRGGAVAHWWRFENKVSIWFDVNDRKPYPSSWDNDGNIYFSVHPCTQIPDDGAEKKEPRFRKSRRDCIAAINCVFAEFDAKDYGDIESIKDHLWALPIYPSVIIYSGGGLHAYWLLASTVSVDDTNRDYIESLQYAWVDLVGGDGNSKDLARVLRPVGTKNRKPKYGPNFPTVSFVECDFERLYSLEEIERLTYDLRKKKPLKPKAARPGTSSPAADIIAAVDYLKRINPDRADDYGDWIAVGMALHPLGDIGLELWEDWSQHSDKYEPGDCQVKWDTFSDDKGKGVTLGTLDYMANEDDPDGNPRNLGGVNDMASSNGFGPAPAATLNLNGAAHVNGQSDHTAQQSTTQQKAPDSALFTMTTQALQLAATLPTAIERLDATKLLKPMIGQLTTAERDGILTLLLSIFKDKKSVDDFLKSCDDFAPQNTGNTLLTAGTHDEGNAQCTHQRHGKKFLYNDAWGWLQYTGTHWTSEGADAAVERAITETLEARIASAAAAGSQMHREIIKQSIPNHSKIAGAKAQMRSMVYASVHSFDNQPDMLNCKNGVVDLRTGDLLPHDIDQRFMYCIGTNYNPDADFAPWVNWLESVTDKEKAAWLQMAQGYSLTGHTREEILIYLYGPSRSGKGTYTSAMLRLMGEPLAKAVQFSMFTAVRGGDDQNFDLAPLKPCRFIAASESRQYERFNEAKIKQITGGDSVSCAFKHRDHFTYTPAYKIWLSSNHPVNADPDDDAVWGRIRVIEFPNSYLGREDKGLKMNMQSETMLEAILAWSVAGARQWYALGKSGLPELKSSAKVKGQQRGELDTLQMWIDDHCKVFDPPVGIAATYEDWCKANSHCMSSTTLYQDYEGWCKHNGVEAKKQKGFSQALERKGFPKGREYMNGAGKISPNPVTANDPRIRVFYGIETL